MFAMFMLVSAALIYDEDMGASQQQMDFITVVLFGWFIACCLLSAINMAYFFRYATQTRKVDGLTGRIRQSFVLDGVQMTQTDDFMLSTNPIRQNSAGIELNLGPSLQKSQKNLTK
jgi:hypothetical protein